MARKHGDCAPINPITGRPNDLDAPSASVYERADAGERDVSAPASHSTFAAGSAQPQAPLDPPQEFAWPGDSVDQRVDGAIQKLRRVFESRIVSCVVLGLLLIELLGLENILVATAAFVVGYMLIERFVNVRRTITMGGIAWLSMLFIGSIVTQASGPLFLNIDYFFMFCGFFLALAVCGSFFAGRAMYNYGRDRGREEADRAIARHVIDRLVEHRDNWDNLDGDYLEVEGAINRVRERERQSAQALTDEARRKDDLVTYLAHDLKTPLASVVGYLSLLEEATDLPAEQRVRFTGIALDKAHRLDALIEEFFDITRFDFHDIVLTRGYVDLGLMLAQVADEFYPILSEQRKDASIEVEPGLTVLVDGDKMARVFNNIMKNAIAYSYEGSTIRVAAARERDEATGKGCVRIRFENQGDPIPAPKLKVIFEKFYRLDAARATNRGGAGLGLAIAKEIVSAHGGAIECISTPEHTVFTITLPE